MNITNHRELRPIEICYMETQLYIMIIPACRFYPERNFYILYLRKVRRSTLYVKGLVHERVDKLINTNTRTSFDLSAT